MDLLAKATVADGTTHWTFRDERIGEPFAVIQGALPPPLIAAWREELAIGGSSAQPWKRYHWLPLERGAPSESDGLVAKTLACVLERLAASLPHTFEAGLAPVVGVEFWTQLRPHDANLQLHWDVDEERGRRQTEAVCPWCSVVCYLTSAGGPTLVIDQRPDDEWGRRVRHQLVWPVAGSILCFPGDRLHGVVGLATPDTKLPFAHVVPSTWYRAHSSRPPLDADTPESVRLTLVYNFWTQPLFELPPLPRTVVYYSADERKAAGAATEERRDVLLSDLAGADGGAATQDDASDFEERRVWLGMYDRKGTVTLQLPRLKKGVGGGPRTSSTYFGLLPEPCC